MNQLLWIFVIFVSVYCDIDVTIDSEKLNIKTDTSVVIKSDIPNICHICLCTVDTINCTGRKLSHHFENDSWPSNNIPLKVVNFEENSIVHLKPFPNITINKLILRFNRIVRIDDKVFEKIRNLTELDLSYNNLTSDILRPSIFEGRFNPNQWEPLPKLRVLNIGYNNLHTLNSDIFAHVPDVEILVLSGNPLDIIDHSSIIALSNLYYLKELSLEYCNLKTLPDHLFHVHKGNLKKLYLNGNQLTTIPSALTEATALEYLNLDENHFKIIDHVNVFPKLPMLIKLSMCLLPHLIQIGSNVFSNLTSLEELDLCNCPQLFSINENAMALHETHVTTWPPLKKLDLSNNKLKYLPENLLGNWETLEQLDLTGNEWSCDCDNQYLVGTLLPKSEMTLMKNNINKMYCSEPPEYAGKKISSLKNRKLRCLDIYGARPERDAALLVGSLIAILLTIPILATIFILWRRGFFICNKQDPASFSRAFYQRASNDDYI